MPTALRLLATLDAAKGEFGPGRAAAKLALLQQLDRARLPTARAVQRLHEALCWLRAYPDDAAVHQQVVAMLDRFDRRADLRRHRRALRDSGLAGTALRYSFYADTARWLAGRHPGALRVVWPGYAKADLLLQRLNLLAGYAETPGLDEVDLPLPQWVQRLKGPHETDADFLIHRCAQLGASDAEREAFYDELDLELELQPQTGTPSRSRACLPELPVHHQRGPLRRERPDLRQALRFAPAVADCDERQGARIIALAREAMVLRHRDLDAFAYASPRDVRLADCGDGLQFAVVGVQPARRLLLEAVYAYLTLQNGVPIGYVLTSGLFGSSEVAYNVFDTYRGGEAGHVYGRVLAVTRQLYGSDTFTVYPYQLGGGGNTEGLRSGAWWFYQKLGFRARDPEVLAQMDRELRRMARDRAYRTPVATLAGMAEANVYWSAGKARDDVIGLFPIGNVGLAVTHHLARRFGSDRERGERVCAGEAAELCAVRGWQKWDDGERLWFQRWAPLVTALPGVADWPRADREALGEVIRKKGGRREADYVRALDGHRRLRRALRELAAAAAP